MATIVGVRQLLVILLPVLLPIHDVISGLAEESAGVAWSGCPPTFAVTDNVSDTTPRCECTTFGEIHCHNLPAAEGRRLS